MKALHGAGFGDAKSRREGSGSSDVNFPVQSVYAVNDSLPVVPPHHAVHDRRHVMTKCLKARYSSPRQLRQP